MEIAAYVLLVSLLLVCICTVCAYDFGGAGLASTRSPPALGALKESTSAMMTKYVRPGFSSSAAAIGVRSALLGHHLNSRELEEEGCVENCCSPCFGGQDLTNPDVIFNVDHGETMTCEYVSDLAVMYSSNDEVCPQIQVVGHAFCGCPSSPPDSCTLCSDGSVVPDPNMIIEPFGDANSYTCGELVVGLLELDADDDADLCSVYQNTVGVLCGCPTSPDPPLTCDLCPPGSVLSNPDDDINVVEGETCGGAAIYAGYIPASDESCASIRDEASLAGCCSDTWPSDSPGVMQTAAPSSSPDGFIDIDPTTEPTSPTPTPSSCPELPTPPCGGSVVEMTIYTGSIAGDNPIEPVLALIDEGNGAGIDLGGPYTTADGIYSTTSCLGSGAYIFRIHYEKPGEYSLKVNGEEWAWGATDVDDAVFVHFTVPALPPPPPPPGPCVGSHVETTINTDNYPGEIVWAIFDDSDGSNVDLGGPPANAKYSSYTASTCLGTGSYTFIIYDSWGDGISEPGGYHVKVDGKEVVSGGGNYGCGENKSFTVPSYEYDIPVMDLSFSFGGEGGNFIRYDCVLDLPEYDVIVLDHACQARVDEYFDISKSVTARPDGRYDAAVNLDILPETMTNPLLFDDSDEANVMYKGCVRIELIRGDDGKRVFFREKSFDITVDMTTGFSSSFESSGADEESDTVKGEINNDLEAYVCDEVGNRYDGPISMSSHGHYFCFEPSENVAVAEISSLVFEKLGGGSFTAIQDGLEDVDVYRIREVESGDNVVQVHLRLPNDFFYSEDTISVSGEVLSTPDVGRRLGNEAAESGRSFFFRVAVQPRKNGMVQTEYTASLAVSGMALPPEREDVRAAAAKAFDSALEDILPDGIFAKTLSIGLEDVPYLRTSRRLDEEEEEVEIVYALTHMIPCEDADCADVETLSAEAFEAVRDSIEVSVADGTLDDAIHEAAVTYNVAGLEAVKVNSESIIVSEPNVEILSASATMEESSTRSISTKKIVAPAMSVLVVIVLGIYVVNKRKRKEENED